MPRTGASFNSALRLALICMPLAGLAFPAGIAQAQDTTGEDPHGAATATASATKPFEDLISNNCVKCHNTTDWAGGLALETLDLAHPGEDPEIWEKAINKL